MRRHFILTTYPRIRSAYTTSKDPPHESDGRNVGKAGDGKNHLTLVGHGGESSTGAWYHVYDDGSHKALEPSYDPKPEGKSAHLVSPGPQPEVKKPETNELKEKPIRPVSPGPKP